MIQLHLKKGALALHLKKFMVHFINIQKLLMKNNDYIPIKKLKYSS
jgi:hypothetical protein